MLEQILIVFPLTQKSDIYPIFQKFQLQAKWQCGPKIFVVRTNNALEF